MTPLRFLHIPKTAGSTFTNLLRHQYLDHYRKGRVFSFTGSPTADGKKIAELSAAQKDNFALFVGHAPIQTGFPQADAADIVTILRDPVSRVKSFCQHVSEGKSHYLLKDFPPESFDLDAFLESGIAELSNLQTKMLINNGGYFGDPARLEGMTAAEAREQALGALFNRIICYGIQEYFDESLVLFSTQLGWRTPYYRSYNEKDRTKLITFSGDHIRRIEQLNTIDIEVYKAARERFLGLVQSDQFDVGRLRRLRMLNKPMSYFVWLKLKLFPRGRE